MDDLPLLAVAHRGGNSIADLRAAMAADVDLIEADINLYRDTLEVRHCKALGPHFYWEKWRHLTRRRDLAVPHLSELLAAAAGDPRLMLDLKGPSLAVATRVAETLRAEAPDLPVAVCTKQWGMLDAFAGNPNVRRIFSASDRMQLSRLRARMRRDRVDGVSIRLSLLTPALVAELRRSTDLVLAWSVDTEAELARARAVGATGITSKNQAILSRLVQERGSRTGAAVAGL